MACKPSIVYSNVIGWLERFSVDQSEGKWNSRRERIEVSRKGSFNFCCIRIGFTNIWSPLNSASPNSVYIHVREDLQCRSVRKAIRTRVSLCNTHDWIYPCSSKGSVLIGWYSIVLHLCDFGTFECMWSSLPLVP